MGFSQFLQLLGIPPAPTLAAIVGRARPQLLLLSILLPALCACFLSDFLAPTNDDTQLDDLPLSNAFSLALPHLDTIWGIVSNFPCFFFLLNVLIVSLVFTSGILAPSSRGPRNGSHLPEAVESNIQTAADLIDGMRMPFGLVFDEIDSHIEASASAASVHSDTTKVGGHYHDEEEEDCNCLLAVHQQPAFPSYSVNKSHPNGQFFRDALEEKPSPCRSYICSDQSVIMRMDMVMHSPSDEGMDDDDDDDDDGSQRADDDPVDGERGHDEDDDNGEHHDEHSAGDANDDLNDGGMPDKYLNVTDKQPIVNYLNDGGINDKYLNANDANDDLNDNGVTDRYLNVTDKYPNVDAGNADRDGGDTQHKTLSTECGDEHHDAMIETELQLNQPGDHTTPAMEQTRDAEKCREEVRGGEEAVVEHGPGRDGAFVEGCGGQRNAGDAMDSTKKEAEAEEGDEEEEEAEQEQGMSTEELNKRADAFILAFRRKLLLTAKEEEDV